MKAGTSSLWRSLAEHPKVFFPATKEPTTLVHEDVTTARGRRRYARFFRAAPSDSICGEASTGYSKLPQSELASQRAAAILGADLRLLYSVRHPLDRAVSHWMHAVRLGDMANEFGTAIDQNTELLTFGHYSLQLKPWLARFPAANFKIVALEALIAEPDATLSDLARFLGLAPKNSPWTLVHDNNASTVRAPSQSIVGRSAQWLRRHYLVKAFLRPIMPAWVVNQSRRATTTNAPRPKHPTPEALESAWTRIEALGIDEFASAILPSPMRWHLNQSRAYAAAVAGRDAK